MEESAKNGVKIIKKGKKPKKSVGMMVYKIGGKSPPKNEIKGKKLSRQEKKAWERST